MNSKSAAPADSSPSGSDIAEHMAPLLELFTQAVANLRALLLRLPLWPKGLPALPWSRSRERVRSPKTAASYRWICGRCRWRTWLR